MNTTSKFLAAAGLIAISAATLSVPAHAEEQEKCYGISKAGKNDCANKSGTHSCAGLAKTDADADEWVLVPKGLCDKLVNGTKA